LVIRARSSVYTSGYFIDHHDRPPVGSFMFRPKMNDMQYGLFILFRGVERSSARMTFLRDVFLAIVQSIVLRRARVALWSVLVIGMEKLRELVLSVVGSLRFFLLDEEAVVADAEDVVEDSDLSVRRLETSFGVGRNILRLSIATRGCLIVRASLPPHALCNGV